MLLQPSEEPPYPSPVDAQVPVSGSAGTAEVKDTAGIVWCDRYVHVVVEDKGDPIHSVGAALSGSDMELNRS